MSKGLRNSNKEFINHLTVTARIHLCIGIPGKLQIITTSNIWKVSSALNQINTNLNTIFLHALQTSDFSPQGMRYWEICDYSFDTDAFKAILRLHPVFAFCHELYPVPCNCHCLCITSPTEFVAHSISCILCTVLWIWLYSKPHFVLPPMPISLFHLFLSGSRTLESRDSRSQDMRRLIKELDL